MCFQTEMLKIKSAHTPKNMLFHGSLHSIQTQTSLPRQRSDKLTCKTLITASTGSKIPSRLQRKQKQTLTCVLRSSAFTTLQHVSVSYTLNLPSMTRVNYFCSLTAYDTQVCHNHQSLTGCRSNHRVTVPVTRVHSRSVIPSHICRDKQDGHLA